MNRDEWRWTDEQGVQRLVRTDELRSALAASVLPASTLVWREGMKEWAPASTVPELASAALSAARKADPAKAAPPAKKPGVKPANDASPAPAIKKVENRPLMNTLVGINGPNSGKEKDDGNNAPIVVPPGGGPIDPASRPVITQAPKFEPAQVEIDVKATPVLVGTAHGGGDAATPADAAAAAISPSIPRAPRMPSNTDLALGKGEPEKEKRETTPKPPAVEKKASEAVEEKSGPNAKGDASPKPPDVKPSPDDATRAARTSYIDGAWADEELTLPKQEEPQRPQLQPRITASSGPLPVPSKKDGKSVPPPLPVRSRTPTLQGRPPASPVKPPSLPPKAGSTPPAAKIEAAKETVAAKKAPPPLPPRGNRPPSIPPEKPNAEKLSALGTMRMGTPPKPPQKPRPPLKEDKAAAQAPAEDTTAPNPTPDAADISQDAPTDVIKAPSPAELSAARAGQAALEASSKEAAKSDPPTAPLVIAPASGLPSQTDVEAPPQLMEATMRGDMGGAAPGAQATNGSPQAVARDPMRSEPPPRMPMRSEPPAAHRSEPPPRDPMSSEPPPRIPMASQPPRDLMPSQPPRDPMRSDAPGRRSPRFSEQVEVPVSSLVGAGGSLILLVVTAFFAGRCSAGQADARAIARPGMTMLPMRARAAIPPPPKPCWVSRQPVQWAPRASKSIPFELVATDKGAIALGYARDANEAAGLEVNPKTGELKEKYSQKTDTEIDRVVPIPSAPDGFVATTAVSTGGGMKAAFQVAATPPFALGIAAGGIAIADSQEGSATTLFKLDGEEVWTAARAEPAGDRGFAITFRRGGGVWGGWLGKDRKPSGELTKIAGSGGGVGKPMTGWNGREVAVIFADKPDDATPWQIRVGHSKAGSLPQTTDVFPLPKGGPGGDAFAPDLVGLADGRWVLAWTEGPPGGRAVRAQTLASDFQPVGDPIALSPPAGSFGQSVLGDAEDNVAAVFLLKGESAYELWGAMLSCGS